jgi:hypothetical protein
VTPGVIRTIREHLIDRGPHQLGELGVEDLFLGKPRRDQVHRQPLGGLEPAGPLRAQGLAHSFELAGGQPIGKGEGAGLVDPDDFGIPIGDDLLEHLPLLVSPELGLASRHAAASADRLGAAYRAVDSALGGPAEGDPLHASRRATVEEDVDVRRRAAKVSGETIEVNTGSSLYSRIGTTHMSMPYWRISAGSRCPVVCEAIAAASPPARAAYRRPGLGRACGGQGNEESEYQRTAHGRRGRR